MDNFRKHTRKSNRPRSIDGFISSNDQPRRVISNADLRRGQYYQPEKPNTIDNFDKKDGFNTGDNKLGVEFSSEQTGRKSPRKKGSKFTPRGNFALSRKEKKKKRSKKKKIIIRSLTTVILLFVLMAGFLFGKAWWNANKVFKGGGSAAALDDKVDPARLKTEGDGRVNILMLGRGGLENEAPDLTDTIMVASIDPVHKEAGLLSIPRDLYVKVPGNGSSKLNAVYANAKSTALFKNPKDIVAAEKAGFKAAEESVEEAMGIPIHYYAMVDYEAFRKSVDTVGGVTIDVKEKLYDPSVAWENNNNPLIADLGVQTFNGKRALLYSRSRLGSARGDFDRSQRQREMILAIKDKILSLGTFSNPLRISQLMDAFGNHAQTNLSLDELSKIYAITKDIPADKVTSLELSDPKNPLVTTGLYANQSVVMPKAGIFNYKDIHNYVRNALKDPYIRDENASITILNGTNNSGLGTKKAEELRSFGYNVVEVKDAPNKNVATTTLVDLRGGLKKYTRHYLELRLRTSATERLPEGINPGTSDFVIILGNNEALNI